MKTYIRNITASLFCVGLGSLAINNISAQNPVMEISAADITADSIAIAPVDEAHELFENIHEIKIKPTAVNKVFAPRVFFGFRDVKHHYPSFKAVEYLVNYPPASTLPTDTIVDNEDISPEEMIAEIINKNNAEPVVVAEVIPEEAAPVVMPVRPSGEIPGTGINILDSEILPKWMEESIRSYQFQDDFVYLFMIENPSAIEYAYWDLPAPPVLLPDDVSFRAYIKKLKLPEIDMEKAVLPEEDNKKIHWLHTFNTLLQFSQAYVSPNWYQGGNNYLALLFNFTWNVQLNQVYHPNLLFQSNLAYKLAMSSNPKNQLHKYTISEDNFQYNLNTGIKAYKNWFYSFNLLFKTQLFNNFQEDSYVRTASFLSPGDLNLGLGMAYSYKNKYNTFQFTATISPLSYNLKTCISDKVDHVQFNISPDKKVKNEIGSNMEFNMVWDITSNINYKTRLFLFSDYHYFLSDWEHTLSFAINKFLSTQIYVHLRYDSSAEKNTAWKNFMMREILSFGLSYTFSTKP